MGGSHLDSDEINLQNSRAEEEDSEKLDRGQQSVGIKDQSTSILVQILLYFKLLLPQNSCHIIIKKLLF